MLTVDLGGPWTLSQANASLTLPAEVPGSVVADLLAAGKLPAPYWRDNEEQFQWIGRADWIYTRSFEVCNDLLAHDRILLRCEGLDTLATIRINGKHVASTDNMHRAYEFDVARLLKRGMNTIEVRFDSAVEYCDRLDAKRKLIRCGENITSASFGYLRKCACNFGWDWGPMLTTAGIWRPIQLIAFDNARLTDVHIKQTHGRNKVTLDVAATVETVHAATRNAAITVRHNGRKVIQAVAPVRRGRARASMVIDHPKLWWPAGMGDQPLYEVEVELLDTAGAMLDTDSRRIGLRTLDVVQKKDKWGTSFRFEANGVPFFAKGANWIPADALFHHVTEEDYVRLLEDALAVNMNFIRVWGGGIYEEEVFYDLCDEMGLCVWQDLAFACAGYPAFDEGFNENARIEAEENIARLRHHPSIALWCGNNEVEGTVVDDEWSDTTMSWSDNKLLFDKVLGAAARRADPERLYWPSSPHTPGPNRREVNDPTIGNAHLWQVWHGNEGLEWYHTSGHRFVSEFGFQSFPEPRTVKAYTERSDRNITHPIMEHHQRSPIGNSKIMNMMLDWFRMPRDFNATLWLSQIQQALAIKTAVEHWRRSMPRTMGAIYWQLNDCWPVASWSSIDYFGRWKALHYEAARFFAPEMLSGTLDETTGIVDVFVVSDKRKSQTGRFSWRLTTVDGQEIVAMSEPAKMPANASTRIERIDLSEMIELFGPDNLMLWMDLTIRGKRVSSDLVLCAKPKQLDLVDPQITTKVKRIGEGVFEVTLKARRPAMWTWIELKGIEAIFSDNFIHLPPGQERTILVSPDKPLTVEQVRKTLVVRSLIDTF